MEGLDDMTRELIAREVKAQRGGVEAVARRMNESRHRLSNLINGRTKMTVSDIDAIRRALSKPPSWPFYEADGRKTSDGKRVSLSGVPLASIPVVGTVAAGPGVFNVDSDHAEIYVPESLASLGRVGFVVEGDSMMPIIEPGTVCVFKEHRSPRRGKVFLLRTRDGDKVKIIDWQDGEWIMRSVNPAYAPESLRDAQLVGYLVGYYHSRGTSEVISIDSAGLEMTAV